MIKKHSITSKAWENAVEFNYRKQCCTPILIDSLYIIGGRDRNFLFHSCQHYDTKTLIRKKKSKLNSASFESASTVFKENNVVSGGFIQNTYRSTNTVEVYDHLDDTWSYVPNMVDSRHNHRLVTIKSKLFVKNFGLLKKPSYDFSLVNGAISIENNILVFQVSWFPKDTSIFFVRH